jgi:DnaK suppressor protein
MKSAPKSKYENYKKLLEKKADELRRSMSAQKVSQLVKRQECVGDEGDLSQQSHEEWIFLNRNLLDMKLLREVQDALHRFAHESYGTCQECEEPISPKRLDAVPWAKYCVACQEQIAARLASGEPHYEDEHQEV